MSSAIANAMLGLICIEASGLHKPGTLTRYYLGKSKRQRPP